MGYITTIRGRYFPVGHGLTYGFKIEDYHILFDIARPTKMSSLICDLKSFFGNQSIDILTLSHFHYDHINGIKELMDSGFSFDKIFIPYVKDEQMPIINLSYIYSVVSVKSRTNRDGSEREIIAEVLNEYSDYDIENDSLFERDLIATTDRHERQIGIQKVKNRSDNKYKSYDPSIINVNGWRFHYMNSDCFDTKIITKFYKELSDIGIYGAADVKKQIYSKYKDIKKIYEKVFKNLNLTSMFLVHGPIDSSSIEKTKYEGQIYYKNPRYRFDEQNTFHSFISGDMYLNERNNQRKIDPYIDKIKYALIPHHSSASSWSDYICSRNKDVLWIVTISKVGSRPYGQVVKDIYENEQEIYICDSIKSFDYEFILR